MTNPYTPMRGRPDRLNCETPEAQSASGNGPHAGQCVHANDPRGCYRVRCQMSKKCMDDDMSPRRATFYWKAPEVAK
jgi:hypothetical protein